MFIALLHVKLDGAYLQDWSWGAIFAPLYVAYGFLFLIIIFLAPGFLDQEKQLYRPMFLISLYWLGTLIFLILLPVILDDYLNWNIEVLFNIFWVMYFIHVVSIVVSFQYNEKMDWSVILEELLWLTAFVLFTVLVFVELIGESIFDGNWFYNLLPLYLVLVGLTVVLSPDKDKKIDSLNELEWVIYYLVMQKYIFNRLNYDDVV